MANYPFQIDPATQRVLIKELLSQMVRFGVLNVAYPVSSRGGYWAQFLWGLPEQCPKNWSVPFIYAHTPEYTDDAIGLGKVQRTFTFTMGAQGQCKHISGHEDLFFALWDRVRDMFSYDSNSLLLDDEYTFTRPGGTVSLQNYYLYNIGVNDISFLSNLGPLDIDNGRAKRFEGLVTYSIYYNRTIANIPQSPTKIL